MMSYYYIYILLWEKDGKFYVGFTNNLNRLIQEHNDGKVHSTRNRRPIKLVYWEGCLNQQDATKREKYLKSAWGKRYIKNRLVRYRYDAKKGQKLKTVELIVESQDWQPSENRSPPNKKVFVRIKYGEIELARMVKSLGGHWNRQKKLWELPWRQVKLLKLEDRIVKTE